MSVLDPRLHAIRPDLADLDLKGRVAAAGYAPGEPAEIVVPVASIRAEPHAGARQTTQALLGEPVRVFERRGGWAWVQLEDDRYVGYVGSEALGERRGPPTHRVSVPLSFLYPEAEHKSQPARHVPMNARLRIVEQDERYARLDDGRYALARHLAPLGRAEPDYAAVAERFLHAPYSWGGKTVLGLDCSGLVQAALTAAGVAAPRDSDMQESLGRALPLSAIGELERGDLVFWGGHVGIMVSRDDLLHANGTFMQVTREPLSAAIARIAAVYGPVTALRRLQ